MKKILIIAMCVALCTGFCACGSDNLNNETSSTDGELISISETENIIESNAEIIQETLGLDSIAGPQSTAEILYNKCNFDKIKDIEYEDNGSCYVVTMTDHNNHTVIFTMSYKGYYGYFTDEDGEILYYETDD